MSVIKIDNVSKIYKLYNQPMDRLKESLSLTRKTYGKAFYALKDVSFEVEKGETVGIIGTNGSGKSTILKIITGVLTPTEGTAEVSGRISALLELGAGFNMDYTGIENVYMNGTMMGFSGEEMDKKIESILEFADIGDFVYQPVKTYSSGMFVRLAFALAISVEPEVFIVDEALSVGDAFFQAKCFNKLEEIKKSGTTILFVSHDTGSVKKLCSRAVWLDKGVVRAIGESSEVCEMYLSNQIAEQNRQNKDIVNNLVLENVVEEIIEHEEMTTYRKIELSKADHVSRNDAADILSFYIKNDKNEEVNILVPNQEYKVGMLVKFNEAVDNALFGFELENVKGVKVLGINNFLMDKVVKHVDAGEYYEVNFKFNLPKICRGEYLVSPSVAMGNQNSHVVIERIHNFMLLQ